VGVDLYQHNFSDDEFRKLAERLHALRGRFLLSINDCPQAREWFQRFHCLEIALTYTAVRKPRQFRELLFANYSLNGGVIGP
jgi:DNA adenine methylase